MAHILAASALACGLALAGGSAAAGVAPDEEDNLTQTIDPGQGFASGPAELTTGHVDIGPRFVDGQWVLQVHDDFAEPSVWRDPSEVVFRVTDDALLTIPDDETYSFLGEPGEEVHVIPQTQDQDVVWVGWNTQAPEILDQLEGGATITMIGIQGPGEVDVYLQSGSFEEPEVLWSSSSEEQQSIFVEVNTHTHANWVFSEPGTYLMRLTIEATLSSGEEVSSTADMRFAVGSETTADATLAAEFSPSNELQAPVGIPTDESGAMVETDQTATYVTVGVGALAAALLIAIVAVLLSTNRAKKKAFAARTEPATRTEANG